MIKRRKFCLCGCGQRVKKNKFIRWHRDKYCENLKKEVRFCLCGCGNQATWNEHSKEWNRYIDGHFLKNKPSWNAGLTKETDERVLRSGLIRTGLPSPRKGLTAETSEKIKRHSEETKQKMRKPHKSHTEETKQNMRKPKSEETKQNMRNPKSEEAKISMKIAQNRPEVKAKHSGEQSSNWKGGISKEPYSQNWTREYKKQIKKRDSFICQICLTPEYLAAQKTLVIHHIDYDKKNCDQDNLTSLCHSCHGKTGYNREEWKSIFASQ